MVASRGRNIERLQVELVGLKEAGEKLGKKNDPIRSHIYWSDFLKRFKLASELFIRVGKAQDHTRGKAWKIENERKSDPILHYLISSRNHDEHPEDELKDDLFVGNFEHDRLNFGKFVSVSRGTNLHISNSVFDGVPVNAFASWCEDSEFPMVSSNYPFEYVRGGYQPIPVRAKDGTAVQVPLNGLDKSKPVASQFADHACAWVVRSLKDLDIQGLW